MEQHPVPQNISSFQFKLIGDITLKQFAYVAGGVILAYIFTKFTFFPWLLRMPLAVITALLGFGLAFVPIEERPMDRWLAAFIKSVYLPTQYVWRKSNPVPEPLAGLTPPPAPATVQTRPDQITPKPAVVSAPVVALPKITEPAPPSPAPAPTNLQPVPTPTQISTPITASPTALFTPEPQSFAAPTPSPVSFKPVRDWGIGAPQSKPAPPTMPKPQVTDQAPKAHDTPDKTTVVADNEVQKLKSNYEAIEKRLTSQMQAMQQELAKGNVTKERFLELQQIVSNLLNEKERMSNELVQMRKQLSLNPAVQGQVVRPSAYVQPPASSQVKVIPPGLATHVGIPQLTSYPNTISGLIKDGEGNTLPNILITVKDKEGVPVRALKTNKLGQFAASTPLANGTYIIEAEDPKKMFSFQQVEVPFTGKLLPPLEISAVSQKAELRQKLSQEIFGQKTI